MHKCNHCNTEFETLDKLRRHSGKTHKISSQSLYNEVVLKNNIPTCKCGCGETPKFISFSKGYKEWIRGHIARVENNWGHNESAIKKSSQTRREQYKNGDRVVWNDGLTKDISKSLEIAGKKISKSFTMDKKLEYSNRMRTMRLEGIVPTRYGKESANWKGGTSSINNLIRANKRLYTEWIYPILKEQNFNCQTCSSTKKLEVHHDKEPMSEILQKFIDKTKEYTFDEKRIIMNDVIDYHINNNISGKVLCKSCHTELHPSYNL